MNLCRETGWEKKRRNLRTAGALRQRSNAPFRPGAAVPTLPPWHARRKGLEQPPELTGADPFEADLTGTTRQSRSLEPESDASDIRPDRVEAGPGAEVPEEEAEPTARPSEWPDTDALRLP